MRILRAHPIGAYFVLAFALSWSYWIVDAFAGGHWSHFPGLVGPALAGLFASAAMGRQEIARLGRSVVRVRVALRWYLAALSPLVLVAGVVVVRIARGDAPLLADLETINGAPEIGWLGLFAVVLVVNGYGEEVGWRGFAWPHLRERYSLRDAALRVGAVWSLWHVPLLFIDSGFGDMPLLVLPGLVVGIFSGSVALGWLYERTGSVFVVALGHTAFNMASAGNAGESLAPVASGAVIAASVFLLRREDPRAAAPRTTHSPSE